MATYVPPKRATAYIIYVGLEDQANAGLFKSNPTLASGDFKVSKDGGSLANLTDLPTVTPASGKMVKITLTATEMTADNVTVVCSDAAGAEWYDLIINIATAANQIDDIKTETAAILEDTGTTLPAAIADVPTVAEFEARTLPAASYFDPAADTVVNVTNVAMVNALATDAVSAAALAAGAVDEILDEVVEGSITLRQAIRIMLARLVNKASGGATTTVTFRDVADTKPRVTMTVDADGNRSAVTLDGA